MVRSATATPRECTRFMNSLSESIMISETWSNLGADVTYKQCWAGLSQTKTRCHNMDGISTNRPTLYISQEVACPFQGDTCLEDVLPVLMEHKGLTFSDYGINSPSKSKVSKNHRLTCAHLAVPKFANVSSACRSIVAFCDWSQLKQHGSNSDTAQSPQWRDYGTMFNTCSGAIWKPLWETTPDRESGEGVGSTRSHSFRAYPLDNAKDDRWLHPDLRGIDGQVWVVVLRDVNIYDPVPKDAKFMAIACFEQYQCCMFPGICTRWGAKTTDITTMTDKLHKIGDSVSAYDLQILYHQVIAKFSILSHLHNTWLTNSFIKHRYTESPEVADKNNWDKEMQYWFETSLLHMRYLTIGLLQPDINWPSWLPRRQTLCSRILFSHSNYTNFDFIQFLIFQSVLLLICGASFRKEIVIGWLKVKHLAIIGLKLANKASVNGLLSLTKSLVWRYCSSCWYFVYPYVRPSVFRLFQALNVDIIRLSNLRQSEQQPQ